MSNTFNDCGFIIKQIDIKTPMPARYRGIDPEHKKSYGNLEYDINKVIPFSHKKINNIIWLVEKMQENGENGIYPENLNKEIHILTVDKHGKILDEQTYVDWLNVMEY